MIAVKPKQTGRKLAVLSEEDMKARAKFLASEPVKSNNYMDKLIFHIVNSSWFMYVAEKYNIDVKPDTEDTIYGMEYNPKDGIIYEIVSPVHGEVSE